MSALWFAAIGTSVFAFVLKYVGQSIPEKFVNHPRLKSVNGYIPVALLSALVAVQSVATKSHLAVDHRLAGLAAATIALLFKAPYFVVVLSAAITSALIVNVL